MNHDNCHCFDCDDSCPDDCYRAQLTRDLKPGMIVTFAHLRGTEECQRNNTETVFHKNEEFSDLGNRRCKDE